MSLDTINDGLCQNVPDRTITKVHRSLLLQVYDEYDEEVANVEAAEEAASCGIVVEDKDAEMKPFLPK